MQLRNRSILPNRRFGRHKMVLSFEKTRPILMGRAANRACTSAFEPNRLMSLHRDAALKPPTIPVYRCSYWHETPLGCRNKMRIRDSGISGTGCARAGTHARTFCTKEVAYRNTFQVCEYGILGDDSLKSASKRDTKSFVQMSKVFVWRAWNCKMITER